MTTQLPAGQSNRPPRGRPRDPRIEPAVLKATRELLAEEGWAAFSVTEVARRAGVTKPALYRRWPSRGYLIYDAIFSARGDAIGVRDTGSMIQDITAGLQDVVEVFQTDVGIASARAIMTEMAGGPPELRARLRDERYRFDNAAVAEIFRRGRERGEYVPPVSEELLAELFVDWVVSRCVLRDDPPSEEERRAIVEALLSPRAGGEERS
jgi:AcrR family transcriptional regulator